MMLHSIHRIVNRKLRLCILSASFSLGIFSANVSQAQTYTNVYWNPTTNGLGGTGLWASSSNFWSTNIAGAGTLSTPNTNFIYNFSGTGGTVTSASSLTVGGINFLTNGYIFAGTGSPKTYTGTDTNATGTNAINIGNGVNLSINVNSTNGFNFNGLAMTGGTGSTVTLIGAAGATNAIIFGSTSANSGRTNSVNTIISGAGTIVLGSGGSSGFTQAGTIVNNSSATLVLTNSASGNVTVSGVVSGTNGLVLNNSSSGKIQLLAANTYSNGTTVINTNGGEIQYSSAAAFGSGTITSSLAGTNYMRALANNLNITNAISIETNNTLRVGTTNTGHTAVYSGVMSGSGSLLYSLSGFLQLLGTNSSFGGGFTAGSSGSVDVAKIGMAGANSSIGTNGVITLGLITTPSSKPTFRWIGTNNDTSDKVINIANASGGVELQTQGNGDLTLNGNINSVGLGGPKTIYVYPYTNSSAGTTNTLSLNGVINDGTPGYVVNDQSIGTIKTTNGIGTGTTNVVTNGVNTIILASVAGVTNGAPISGGGCIAPGTTITAIDTTGGTNKITLSALTTNTASISAGLAVMNVAGATAATSLNILPKSSGSSTYVNIALGSTSNSFSGGVLFTNSQSGLISLLKISKFGNAGENSSLGTAANVTFGGSSGTTCTLDYIGSGAEVITNKSITLGGSVGTVGLSVSGTGSLKLAGGILPGPTNQARTLSLTGSSTGTGEIASNLGDMNGFALSVQKDGSGTWTLSGTNSFTGLVKIQGAGSVLRFNSPDALPSAANLDGNSTSGSYTLEMVGSSTNYKMNRMITGYMIFKSTNGPSTLTFTNDTTGSLLGGSASKIMTALSNATVVFAGPYDMNAASNAVRTNTLTGDGVFRFNGTINGSTIGTNVLVNASNCITYLNASNNYNGGTQVQGGTLVVNHSNAIPSVGTVVVSSGAALQVNAVVTNTIASSIVNGGTVKIASGGSMLASQITGGAVEVGASSGVANLSVEADATFSSLRMTGNGNISLPSSATLFPSTSATFSGSGNKLTLNNVPGLGVYSLITVSAPTGLNAPNGSVVAVVNGSEVPLNGAVTQIGNYNYAFQSTSTQLQLSVTSAGANALTYNFDVNGAWDTNSANANPTWLTGAQTPINFSNTDLVSFTGGGTNTVTVSGIVQPGALTFTNSSGVLTLSGGTIQTPELKVIGGGQVNISSAITKFNDVLGINISRGTLNLNSNVTASDVTVSGGLLGGSALLTADTYTLTGGEVSISLGGSGTMNLGGTVTLSGDNTYFTGRITISGASVSIAGDSALGSGTISLSGGAVLNMNNGMNLSNAVSLGSGGGTVSVAGDASSAILSGGITNSLGTNSLTKSGTGMLTLGGLVGSTNSHVGLNVATGNLVLSGSEKSIASVSNGAVLTLDGVLVNTRGGVFSGNGSISVTNSVTLSNLGSSRLDCTNVVNIAPGGVLNVGNSSNSSYSQYWNGVNGTNGKLVSINGTNRLSGISTVGTIEINSGAGLRLENGTITDTTVTNNGKLIFANSSSITNVIGGTNFTTAANGNMTGSGFLVHSSSKNLILGGQINGGLTISLENTNKPEVYLINSNNFTGGIVFATNNCSLWFSNNASLGSGLINAAGSTNAQVGLLVTNEPVSWTIGNPISTGTSSNSVMNISPLSNNTLTLTGLISGSGWLKVGSSASGYLEVANTNNTYAGGTEIGNGAIVVSDGAALGTGSINFSTASNSILKITGDTTFSQPKMTIGAVSTLTNSAIFEVATGKTASVNSTIGVNTSYSNYSNQVVSVRKIGSGTLVLTANNTYAGATSVEGGKLSIQYPYLSSSNNVSLTNNPTLDLDFSGTNTIAKLIIDGVEQSQGTWGRLGSSANKTTALITGSGFLRVTSGPLIPATVTLPSTQLAQLYDGNPKSVTPTTTEPGASFIVRYNGSITPPTAVGTYTVLATVSAPYSGSASDTLTINKGVSSFVWPTNTSFTYTAGVSQAPLVASTTGSSGGVTYSYVGLPPTGYSSTNKPTLAGSYKVIATVAADGNYGATTEERNFTIAKAGQTITFNSPGSKRYGGTTFTLGATSSSGLSVTYVSYNTNVATVSSNTVTIVGVGSAVIKAQQDGDANYNAAEPVNQNLLVNPGFNIMVLALTDSKAVGDANYTLAVTKGAGSGALSFSSSTPGVATIDASGLVSIQGAGTTTFTVNQAADANYNAAEVTQTLTVAKGVQTITGLAGTDSKNFGAADYTLAVTKGAGSGALSFSSSTPGVATIDPSSGLVSIKGAGTTTFTVNQAADANYNAAEVTQTLTVAKGVQTITGLAATDSKNFGTADYTLAVTKGAGSGALSFSSSTPGVATIDASGLVSIKGAGTTTFTVNQAADDNYDAAMAVTQTLTVAKGVQTITGLAATESRTYTYGGIYMDYDLTVTKGAGSGALSYSSSNTGVATIHPTTGSVHIVGAGTTTLTVNQAADDNYALATVSQILTVAKGVQTITGLVATDSKNFGAADYTLAVTKGAGSGALSYSSSTPGVATIDPSSGLVSIKGAGTTTFTVNQAADANYDAAPAVTQILTVTQSGMTFASWSTNATLTSDLLYKYAFGAANKNSEAQKMTSSVTSTNLILTAVVRTNDTAHLTITAKTAASLAGPWSTPASASLTESIASSQSGVSDGLVRKDFKVERGSDTKRFLKLEVIHTQ